MKKSFIRTADRLRNPVGGIYISKRSAKRRKREDPSAPIGMTAQILNLPNSHPDFMEGSLSMSVPRSGEKEKIVTKSKSVDR